MIAPKITYEVGNFEFDNLKDAENFNSYLNVLSDNQLNEIYFGYQSKIDYTIYAKPEFSAKQMEAIRLGLLKNLDVKIYSDPNIKAEDMERIRKELEKNIDNSNIDWFAEIQRIKLEMESKK